MIWAAPAAWALALLAALPLIAHLWSRKRPAALPFPTLRFLRAASPVSRRLRRVQDWPLLLLRLAIVVVICAAAAGPTLDARWRQQAWRSRLHRVIVVDADVAGATASAAVNDLRKDVASSTVLGPAEIADVFDDAIAQADRSAADRRTELVVVWSGSRTTLAATDVADIPARVGVRLVPIDAGTTAPESAASSPPTGGIDIQTSDAALRESLLADLGTLGLPASATPIRLRWAATGCDEQRTARDGRVPAAKARRGAACTRQMSADVRLREAAERSLRSEAVTDRGPGGPSATVLARSSSGEVLLRGWAEGGCLVLDLDAVPRSPLTWWSLVSAREALARIDRLGPAERWSSADVARANRDALVPTGSSLPGGLDTRSAWAIALALLLVEQGWRRRGATARDRDVAVPDQRRPRPGAR